MRAMSQPGRAGHDGPQAHSPQDLLGATVALAGGFLAAVAAVLYPLVALGVLGTAVAARPAVRALVTLRRARRRRGRTRSVCVPGTGVCVEA